MKKYLGFVAISAFLFYCADDTRDNPQDERAVNYIGKSSAEGSLSSVEADDEPSSSSGEELSSSSVEPSSSSAPPSSSSEAESSSSKESPASSSSAVSSSSSAPPSSSSEAESSSSKESPASSSSAVSSSSSASPSSSSVAPSSSSVKPSSSSAEPSSSSEAASSSSVAPSSSSAVSSSSSASPSSSSVAPSSSSVTLPSSSSEDLCANFVEGTTIPHYGKDKKQFCDERDGKKYVYVVIGEGETAQTWMAENLNYAVSGSKCGDGNSLSDNNTSTCDTYGRLYNWATAMGLNSSCNSSTCSSQIQPKHRGVCPSGWHIPSYAEWDTLMTSVGGEDTAGTKLKATSKWNEYQEKSGNDSDIYGFSALPGGYGELNNCYSGNGKFCFVGDYGSWWSASENNSSDGAYTRFMNYNFESASWIYRNKSVLFSVRCLKDD